MVNIRIFQSVYTKESQQCPQYLAGLSAILSALACGLHYGWPSPFLPKIQSTDFSFKVSSEEASYVAMIAPLGYIIGCPLTACIVDVIGRKRTVLLLAVPQLVSWTLIATASSVMMLASARVISGVGEGAMFTVLPMYLCEICEPKIRGLLGTSLTVAMVTGMFLINCYGSYVSMHLAALISLTVPLFFIITFIWMPESPYYFLMKGKEEEARASLKSLRRMHDVETELVILKKDVNRQISESGTLKDVFVIPTNRKAFIIILCTRAAQQLGGISAIVFYMQSIFKEADGNLTPEVSAIIFGSAQVAVSIFGSILIDKYGRRPLLMTSSFGTGVLLFLLGIYFYIKDGGVDVSSFTWVPILCLLLYTLMFNIGLGIAPNLMMGELLSASVKAKTLCMMNLFFAFCISFTAKLFHSLDESFGMCVPFFIFGVCCFVSVVFTYVYVPETMGKSLEEIQELLKKNTKRILKESVADKYSVTRF